MTLRLSLDGLSVALGAAESADLEWLVEFYGLGDDQGSEPPPDVIPLEITLTRDRLSHAAAARRAESAGPGPGWTMSGRDGSLRRWREGGAGWGWDPELEIAIRVTADAVEVIGDEDVVSGRVGLMRVLRDLHERHLLAAGGLLLHASAVAGDDGVVVIAGPKKSGKTTLATYLLAHAGAAYTSNDRVVLMPDGRVIGIPTIVSLRAESRSHLIALPPEPPYWTHSMCFAHTMSHLEALPPPDRSPFRNISPAQYHTWLGAPASRSGRAIALLFPRVGADQPPQPTLEPLDEGALPRELERAVIEVDPDGLLSEVAAAMPKQGAVTSFPPAYRCMLGAYPPVAARSLLKRLIERDRWRRAARMPAAGWDFSSLAIEREPPPWSYEDQAVEALRRAQRVLDLGTGGGEVLATLLQRAGTDASVTAVERHPPNVAVARARLAPLGVDVVVTRDLALPFEDGSFDLVLNRHAGFRPSEVARVLGPGGRYLTQQIDPRSHALLRAVFGRDDPPDDDYLSARTAQLEAAGMEIAVSRAANVTRRFGDVATLVRWLSKVPWSVPGFSVACDLDTLWRLADAADPLAFDERYLLIEARKRSRV